MSEKIAWFVLHSGKEQGPFSSPQLKQLANTGKINRATQIRRGTDGRWATAGQIKNLFAADEQTSPVESDAAVPPVLMQSQAGKEAKELNDGKEHKKAGRFGWAIPAFLIILLATLSGFFQEIPVVGSILAIIFAIAVVGLLCKVDWQDAVFSPIGVVDKSKRLTVLILAMLFMLAAAAPENEKLLTVERSDTSLNQATAPRVPTADQPTEEFFVEAKNAIAPDEVTITIEIVKIPGGRIRIHGTTNLPADTNLMLSVDEQSQDGFIGQSKCSVAKNGTFVSETFGPTDGFEDGVYVAGVVMPIPRMQPDNVKKIIGSNGENLLGPFVENGSFGVTVSLEKEFTIGGVQAAQVQKQRVADRIQQYHEWKKKIIALHSRLQTACDDSDLERWGKFGRQFRNDIQSHQEQLMQLPMSARFAIGDPLDDIRRMFHATSFQKPQDFKEASIDYAKSFSELEKFIAESVAAQ